jgi:Peptidase family C25
MVSNPIARHGGFAPVSQRATWPLLAALVLVSLLFLAPSSGTGSPTSLPDPITLEASDGAGTRFVIDIPPPRFIAPPEKGAGVRVEVPGFLPGGLPGAPELPARTVLVAVPAGSRADLRFTIEDDTEHAVGAVAAVPVPGPRPPAGEIQRWERIPDPEAYRSVYPARRVEISAVETARHLDVVGITIWPAEVDPARGVVRVARRIRVEVTTTGGRPSLPARAPGSKAADSGVLDAIRPAELGLAPVINPEAAIGFIRPAGATARPRAAFGAGPSFQSSTHWVRLHVAGRGLVRVTGGALATAGVNLQGIDPQSLRIFWGGGFDPESGVSARSEAAPAFMQECAIEVTGAGDARLDAGDAITFLGQGARGWLDDYKSGPTSPPHDIVWHDNQQARYGVFWLTWSGDFPDPPRRLTTRGAAPEVGAPIVNQGRARHHYEVNRRYIADLFERNVHWERWFDSVLRDSGPPTFYPFTAVKPVAGVPGSLRLRLWGYTSTGRGQVRDHYALVSFNQTPIPSLNPAHGDTFIWDGPRSTFVNGRQDVTSQTINVVEGQNRVVVDVVPVIDGPQRDDQVAIAWYNVSYLRRLDFTGEQGGEVVVPGGAGVATVEVTGAAPNARVIDVSDPLSPVELTQIERQGATLRFAATVVDPARPPKFLVGTPAMAAARIEVDQSQPDLRRATNAAWYVVIAHDSMIQEATRLASAHAAVVPPEGPLPGTPIAIRVSDVMDEFGWGLRSEIAIRNFVDYALHTWAAPPRYVCLLGDASFDALDYNGDGDLEGDLVPAPRTWNFIGGAFGGSEFLSDDWYARTFGDSLESPPDRLTDLFVGRLPAGSVEEARVMVDEKTIPVLRNPECGMWRQRAVLSADDEFVAGNPIEGFIHQQFSDTVATRLPIELERIRVYLHEYPMDGTGSKPEGRAAFIQAFNDGAAFVNYIGHGSPDQLAHESLFKIENVGQLTNGRRLPIFSTFSCTVNRFDEPAGEGLGEALVSHRGGGSVASLGSTDLAFVSGNLRLNTGTYQSFYEARDFVRPVAIGAASAAAKNVLAVTDSSGARKYVLLGDPALPPPTPRSRLALRFPGTVAADTVRLVAGVPYQLVAHFAAGGPSTTAEVVLRDSELIQVYRIGGDATFINHAGNPFFRSRLSVPTDTLRTPFVVPIDATQSLSVNRGAGEARVYVADCPSGNVREDGLGWQPLFLDVEGAQPTEPDSDGGPDVTVEFDGNAGAVPPNSRLTIRMEDKSGIDIVGNTPSTAVFMRLDEVTTVVLSDRFAYDAGSATAGSIEYDLTGVSEGPHVLKVYASDNYLNRTEVEVPFAVVTGGEMAIRRPGLYPNPFEPAEGQGTVLSFELPEAAEVSFRIFSVTGRLIREEFKELSGTVGPGQRQIYWDGRDEEGDLVANGVYLCSISARGLITGGRDEIVLRSVVRR